METNVVCFCVNNIIKRLFEFSTLEWRFMIKKFIELQAHELVKLFGTGCALFRISKQ